MLKIVEVYFEGNKASFAKKIGIAPTSITNYIGKQRASKPSSDLLEKIVNSLDVDAMWLLTGKGDMNRSENTTEEIELLKMEILSLKESSQTNEVERLKAEINQLIGENRILREQVGLSERKPSTKSA